MRIRKTGMTGSDTDDEVVSLASSSASPDGATPPHADMYGSLTPPFSSPSLLSSTKECRHDSSSSFSSSRPNENLTSSESPDGNIDTHDTTTATRRSSISSIQDEDHHADLNAVVPNLKQEVQSESPATNVTSNDQQSDGDQCQVVVEDQKVDDPNDEGIEIPVPSLTSVEEARLLAEYEACTSFSHGLHHADENADGGLLMDTPLTMEDSESDLDFSPSRRNFVSEMSSVMLPPVSIGKEDVENVSLLQGHKRLPSTIYEEGESATPMTTARAPDLPRIESSSNDLLCLASPKDTETGNASDENVDSLSCQSSLCRVSSSSSLIENRLQKPFMNRSVSTESLHSQGSQPLVSSPSSRAEHERKLLRQHQQQQKNVGDRTTFRPSFVSTTVYQSLSVRFLKKHTAFAATWIGFWALLNVTCINYVLTPLRDAIAIKVGVKHIPMLTLASTALAFVSSVPIGWLFEAPDPSRRKVWKRMGLTRGETQGTSLALYYRCFALVLISYAVGFSGVEWLLASPTMSSTLSSVSSSSWISMVSGKAVYVAFFLVVHLMKLHSLSLVWGVTTEAMEYEEVARKNNQAETTQTRLQRLALVGFGGTLGGIIGSGLTSSMAQILRLPGLLILAAVLLEIAAQLSIELGRIMQMHWETQQLFQSSSDLTALDTSMRRSVSLGSMKRVASGNSLSRAMSASDLTKGGNSKGSSNAESTNDGTFAQRLLRGVRTILQSRLLMAIFTYNALYASTTVLLSFQRAELIANRNKATSAEENTAFLANINMASSIAIFALQASGLGALLANKCGPRGTLSLMPLVRLAGVLSLAWWHKFSSGHSPNLLVFLMVDECCKIMNLAVAKPVRESLWRGLSNEARYEAKPIVDTLANRWGGGSAAFLVSFIHHTLDWFGYGIDSKSNQTQGYTILDFPPILFLGIVISAWWLVVSADLGHVRSRIDIELKKRQ